MSLATASSPMPAGSELNTALREAVTAVDALFADARRSVAARVTVQGRPMARAFDREQRATHGLAWPTSCTPGSAQPDRPPKSRTRLPRPLPTLSRTTTHR